MSGALVLTVGLAHPFFSVPAGAGTSTETSPRKLAWRRGLSELGLTMLSVCLSLFLEGSFYMASSHRVVSGASDFLHGGWLPQERAF